MSQPSRRLILAGLGAALAPSSAVATAISINQVSHPAPPATTSPTDAASLAAGADPSLRMTVPVLLNEAGPYTFVVDTGANRSVVSAEAALALSLPDAGPSPVHGIAGVEVANTVHVDALSVGAISARDLRLPLLQGERLGAQGLIGIDVLKDRQVTLDFINNRLEITRPQSDLSSRSSDPGFQIHREGSESTVRVPAHYEGGQLIIVDASVGGIPVHAFLDSGSEDTVGNLALRERALLAMPNMASRLAPVELLSATGQIAHGDLCQLPPLRLAGLTVDQLNVVFSELHTFELWGLSNRPALLIGMDVLRRFDSVDLDFGHHEVRFHYGVRNADRMADDSWLTRARALQAAGDLDGAQAALGEAISEHPDHAEAQGDLAQLIWMRTGDVALAGAALNRAILAHPFAPGLRMKKSALLETAGDAVGAYRTLAVEAADHSWPAQVQLAQHASRFDPPLALRHAEQAVALEPHQALTQLTLCQTELGVGRADAAAKRAEAMLAERPDDQLAIALAATAWRLLADPRYGRLFDYDSLVRGCDIAAPDGWRDVGNFLDDLADELQAAHGFRAPPMGQSVRGGSQTQASLMRREGPAIRALFAAFEAPIRAHLAGLGSGEDPVRRRATGRFRFAGAWSVRLAPGGFHTNHVHQSGWLSSAFHVRVPASVELEHQGWLKFGEPGVATDPPLAAEHFAKPVAGRLCLFPSYMWHGTEPFGGPEPRLSVAFDLLPA